MILIRSDDGGEYIGKESDLLKKKEIVHEVTMPYSLDSYGCTEPLNWTLMDIGRALLIDIENAQEFLWEKAINSACYIQNRLVTKSCNVDKTPFTVIRRKVHTLVILTRLDHVHSIHIM